MAICYDRLFHLMIDKKISNAQLKEKAGFSANIITQHYLPSILQDHCDNGKN